MAHSVSGHFYWHLPSVLVMTYSLITSKIGLCYKTHKILSEILPGNSFMKNSVKSGVHSGLTYYMS